MIRLIDKDAKQGSDYKLLPPSCMFPEPSYILATLKSYNETLKTLGKEPLTQQEWDSK